jgi:hypothetical protein
LVIILSTTAGVFAANALDRPSDNVIEWNVENGSEVSMARTDTSLDTEATP